MDFAPYSSMNYAPFQQPPNLAEEDGAEEQEQERPCKQGHRASLQLRTSPGGCICLLCFSNLLAEPSALLIHRAYAVSQLLQALDDAMFRDSLLQNHRHFLVSPLTHAICTCSDETLAKDITDIVVKLCTIIAYDDDAVVLQDFLHHLLLQLASSAIVWTRGQTYALHCLGLLLELHCNKFNTIPNSVRNQKLFMFNLVHGLRLPSDEVRGEILFVLYKFLNLEDGLEELLPFCPRLIHLAVEALMKTERDELRTNCLAFLTSLAKQEVFNISLENLNEEGNSMETDHVVGTVWSQEGIIDGSFVRTFAEAVKGPLLSSDVHVQISTLELIYYACQIGMANITKELCILIEEGTMDYIFEILRLSDNMEPLVIWCIRALSLLSAAEPAFTQRFSIGFPTVIRVLGYVAEITLHPVQTDTLMLISTCLSNCPGIISTAQAEDLLLILTKMLNQHVVDAVGLSSDAFSAACSAFIFLLNTPSCHAIKGFAVSSILEVLKNVISYALDSKHEENMLHSLDFFRGAFIFTLSDREDSDIEIAKASLVEICEIHLLPSVTRMSENEETVHAFLKTICCVLQDTSVVQTTNFAEKLAVSSWFSFSFESLARFPSNDVRTDIFLIFSLLIDQLVGNGLGEAAREASSNLPSDPVDLLFLLGQKSSCNSELLCSQSAIISILYASYLYRDRFADDNQVLASLEQYILVNASNFLCGLADSTMLIQILDLYAFIRETSTNFALSHSSEAEKLLLGLIAECNCDFLSARLPKAVMRWLFHQNEIEEFLMAQILNLCRCICNVKKDNELGFERDDTLHNTHSNCLHVNISVLTELIEQEDCGTALFVSLLKQMVDRHAEDDLRAVLHLLMRMIKICPGVSNRFHANGIVAALHQFYFATTSREMLPFVSLLVFIILYFANIEALTEEDLWLGIAHQVMHILVGRLKDKNSICHESVLLFSLLALMLQKSKPKEGLLLESSRAIVLNSHLGSAVENIVGNACAKGAALAQLSEKTSSGQILISALVYHLFWLRRVRVVLQDTCFQEFFFIDDLQHDQALPSDICTNNYGSITIKIQCRQLCQLLYFGSPIIKLVASYSLAEVFSCIAEKTAVDNNSKMELKCTPHYLQSVLMVLQGFILQDNIFLAKNAASCIYWLLGCEYFNAQQQKAIAGSNWYRLILEELTLSLATPNSISYSLTSSAKPKPAAYVAIALLRLSSRPAWTKVVFSPMCITSIIENFSSQKPGPEIVLLFRTLLCSGYIEPDHISKLHHLFQEFRRFIYVENLRDQFNENIAEKWRYSGKNCITMMVDLIMSLDTNPITGIQTDTFQDEEKEIKSNLMRLVAEIDRFLQESSAYV